MMPPTMQMIMDILRCMPRARHHSLVCSAGPQGYHALKEMLLSGVEGNTLLIESGDLRGLCADMNAPPCSILYKLDDGNAMNWKIDDCIPTSIRHVDVFTSVYSPSAVHSPW